jgi:hypothetical protein
MNEKMKISPIDQPIGAEDAARLIGVTPSWLHALERKGLITKLGRGQYSPVNVVAGYVKSIADDRPATAHAVSVADLAATKARIAKLKAEELEGSLINKAAAWEHISQTVAEFFVDISSLPAAFTRDLPERRRLEQMINAIRNRFAKKVRDRSK